MSIVRGARRERFAVVAQEAIDDERLSWKARGLLVYLLSKPDHWETSYRHLMKVGPDGQASILAGLKELEEHRYLVRATLRNEAGQVRSVSTVFETPQVGTVREFSGPGFPVRGEPTHIVNTEVVKTEEKPIRSAPPSSSASVAERLFDEIWKAYPRKVARKAALKAFVARLRAKDANPSDLAVAVRNYAAAVRGKDPEYIMHGSTFFGPGERWKDYLAPHTSQQSSARRTSSMPWMD